MISLYSKIKAKVKLDSKQDKLVADISKLRSIGYKNKINKINEKYINF